MSQTHTPLPRHPSTQPLDIFANSGTNELAAQTYFRGSIGLDELEYTNICNAYSVHPELVEGSLSKGERRVCATGSIVPKKGCGSINGSLVLQCQLARNVITQDGKDRYSVTSNVTNSHPSSPHALNSTL